MSIPLISVIVATTSPDDLTDCLGSLARQNIDRDLFEVIAVGHPLPEAATEPNVFLVPCLPKHPSIRRNLGIFQAKGRLLGFLDDDAVVPPDWLENAWEQYQKGRVVFTGPETPKIMTAAAGLAAAASSSLIVEGLQAHVLTSEKQVPFYDVPLCNCFVTRSLFQQVGKFNETIDWHADDVEFFYRVQKFGVACWNIPELCIRHDRYPPSLGEFLKYKYRTRIFTGWNTVRLARIYLKIPAIGLFLVGHFLLAVMALAAPRALPFLFLIYAGILHAAQWRLLKKGIFFYIKAVALTILIHLAIVAGFWHGALKALAPRRS
ncbi:MAG: glycosyltransferase [Elusimicrobia bacterium]|nr:glycosyltransferase [Elusimicrobiota bacterium]